MADVFEHAVVTTKGLALQAKVATGGSINFTRVKMGAGVVEPVLMQKQTDVSQPKQEFLYNTEPTFTEEGEVVLQVIITNDDVTTGYDCYQMGIFATDPDDGEILYAIIQGEKPLSIPSADSMAGWTAEFNFYLQFGNADSVTVVVTAAGLLTIPIADARYLSKNYKPEWIIGEDEEGVYIMKGE